MLGVLLIVALPLLIDLDRHNPKHWMEGAALASSQETWLSLKGGDHGAWLRPTLNGTERRNKPPLLVWSNMLAWADLDPGTSTATQLMHRARLVSVALGLVLVASVYWLGRSLRGHSLALLAAGVAGTLPYLFQIHARLASYDIHMVAWATLASAAGLWAAQPFSARPSARRAVGGSVICGIALGLSCLSKNPLGLVMFVLLVIPLLVLDRQNLRSRTVSIFVALLVTFAVAAPWYLYHWLLDPATLSIWTREYSGVDSNDFEGSHILKLIQMSLPWTFWLAAGLFHPFFIRGGENLRRRLIPWLWFVLILVVFSGHKGNAPRYILPILPAMALVIAQVIDDDRRNAETGRRTRGLRLVAVDHWVVIAIASVAVPLLLWSQPRLVESGWVRGMLVCPIGFSAACILATLLLGFAVVAIWQDLSSRVFRSAFVMVAWTIVLSTVCWQCYASTPSPVDACRADAEEIAQVLGEAPLRFLRTSPEERLPDLEFLFFMRRTARTIRPHHIDNYISQSPGPHFIMADPLGEYARLLPELGFEQVGEFEDEPSHLRVLWRRAPDP